tara:strand:+ start:110 stop:292 length:183 start_codon:yes stop_codon:yes gene_type:complete
MNEEKQLVEFYANSLASVSKSIKIHNVMGKEKLIIKLVEDLARASDTLIRLLKYDKDIMA